MACIGGTYDEKIAELVVQQLKTRNSIDWNKILGYEQIENSVRKALEVQNGGEKLKSYHRLRSITNFVYGLMYFQQPQDIDWPAFHASLNHCIKMMDFSDF